MKIIGIGTEIIECVRIAKMIERHGEMFLERVFTPAEVDFCSSHASALQHYAARWAAKEATMKALSGRTQGIRWTEIEVISEPAAPPRIVLRGNAADWADRSGISQLQLSLGACRTHATAFVVAT